MRNIIPVFLFIVSVLSGCSSGNNTQKNRGAIIFGDSALIVTENDPRYLIDNIADFVPQKTQELSADSLPATTPVKADTVKTRAAATVKPVKEEPVSPSGKGLELPFRSFTVFMEGIKAKSGKGVDWNKAKGISLTLEQGDLNNKRVTVKTPDLKKVMQRYQTVVLLKMPNGKEMRLSALPAYTSEWQNVKFAGTQFSISGLAKGQLKYASRFSSSLLNNAVQKLARSSRMSKKETDQLLKSVRNVRNAAQAPLSIALQSATWKITAKDAAGKTAEKEIRVDINR